MSYPVRQVRDLCDLVNGKAFKPADWSEAGEPIIRIQNLNDPRKLFNFWAGSLQNQVIVCPGDVLFAWSGTPGTSFGGHIWAGSRGVLNQHIFRVDLDERLITKKWFVGTINHKLNVLIQQAHGGVGLQHVTRGMIDSLELPLPSLKEQRRIAAILDQVDDLRSKRQECLETLDLLLSASFFSFFGDPINNDRNWQRIPFDEILLAIEGGWSPNCLDRPANDTEWGVLKLGAVTYGRYDDLEQKSLPDDTAPRPELEVQPGDLLFTRKNTHALVGACALVRETRSRLMIPDLIFRLHLDKARAHPEYVRALLSNPGKRKLIQNLASGAAGSMPNISKARLKTVAIELPPFELQAKFAAVAQAMDALRKKMLAESAHLDALFASLQHRAFTGELTAEAAQREVAAAE